MKIYIAGAITGNPNYKEQFKAAEERLKAAGHTVINPVKNEGFTYREYINIGLCELMHCDAIYLLKGYELSTGATLEHDYARTVELDVFKEEDEVTPDDVTVEIVHKAWLRTAKTNDEVDQKTKGIIADALSKQIPKKVSGVFCPVCKSLASSTYCEVCGQRLDWQQS